MSGKVIIIKERKKHNVEDITLCVPIGRPGQ